MYDNVALQKLYYRIAKDSGFKMDPVEVAQFGAQVMKCSPLQFWIALGYDNMTRVANGTLTPKWND